MKNIFYKSSIIIFTLAIFLGVFHYSQAVSLDIILEKEKISINEQNKIDFFINSQKTQINIISGSIKLDKSLLHLEKIIVGNSIVSFWMDQPKEDESGLINFSGIIPGGIVVEKGYLFSIIVSGVKVGQASISVVKPEVFLNDGEGTKISATSLEKFLTVNNDKISSSSEFKIEDAISPEKFTITRSRDEHIFDNKWFITFASQDKGSGISHYKICESFFKKCVISQSPYMLKNQSPFYNIRVVAYDENGNIQRSSLVSLAVKILYASLFVLGILMVNLIRIKKRKRRN